MYFASWSTKLVRQLLTTSLSLAFSIPAAVATASSVTTDMQSTKSDVGVIPNTEDAALHVLNRLGYGPKPGDINKVLQTGVKNYIQTQLHPETIPLPDTLVRRLDSLSTEESTTGQMLGDYLMARKEVKEAKSDKDGKENADNKDDKQKGREILVRMAENTAESRLARAIESPRQLEEVMVDFWFNHFNIFAGKGLDRALILSYERDAIRPNVFGNFRTLLGATAKHPAMLFYLDNWMSTSADYQPRRGRGGKFGQLSPTKNKPTGLNENYARELMELHTLGVDGGYSQKDVTELARMLTGWTFNQRDLVRNGVQFTFNADAHDNGHKVWMGKDINPRGQQEGEFALDILAMHPNTAHHIAFELAQYFVSDNPPEALVNRMAQRYLDTRGEIRPVLEVLFYSPEFFDKTAIGNKFKTPYQFVLSSARASALPINNIRPLLGVLSQLGMPLYGSVTPDGYKNTEAAWLNPDAITRRINFATALASGRLPLDKKLDETSQTMGKKQLEKQADGNQKNRPDLPALDANALLATLGSSISAPTRELINGNKEQLRGALVLGSPDFMHH
ncbi:DUF1800 domain-containing protein [Undibacterium sp. 5I1]|uniref:DUF1800 domain-containing protein n=1 Tax=unclassified Undibacterium TaxID=2630295 RepID=UPI002AB57B1E|nr:MULTISPECIES: DUF1800 domain-containing protein [unclassified Undibacterium]MDY7537371.1 DUF1800 domain-containing protein [Undibacterium sp. 5I1]MEB0232030.1 DUF1800 domain-containing protein [Undibacterium sp. 10I3]MEB0259301.1 DUF1800 domain-containing protein [Undibacterium sp. 5I1]